MSGSLLVLDMVLSKYQGSVPFLWLSCIPPCGCTTLLPFFYSQVAWLIPLWLLWTRLQGTFTYKLWAEHLSFYSSVWWRFVSVLCPHRSSLTCPHCLKQSNTFDPFLCVSLPIPLRQTRYVSVLSVVACPLYSTLPSSFLGTFWFPICQVSLSVSLETSPAVRWHSVLNGQVKREECPVF